MTLNELVAFCEKAGVDFDAELDFEVEEDRDGSGVLCGLCESGQGRIDGVRILYKGQSFRCVEAVDGDTITLLMV